MAPRSSSICRGAQRPSQSRPSAVAVEAAEGGSELILVVEDDALVRNYVITQIRSLGYRTLSAANAEEALAASSRRIQRSICCSPMSSCRAR